MTDEDKKYWRVDDWKIPNQDGQRLSDRSIPDKHIGSPIGDKTMNNDAKQVAKQILLIYLGDYQKASSASQDSMDRIKIIFSFTMIILICGFVIAYKPILSHLWLIWASLACFVLSFECVFYSFYTAKKKTDVEAKNVAMALISNSDYTPTEDGYTDALNKAASFFFGVGTISVILFSILNVYS